MNRLADFIPFFLPPSFTLTFHNLLLPIYATQWWTSYPSDYPGQTWVRQLQGEKEAIPGLGLKNTRMCVCVC